MAAEQTANSDPNDLDSNWSSFAKPQGSGADSFAGQVAKKQAPQLAEGADGYQFVSFHEQGGQGQVWKFLDAALDREVAVKIPMRAENPEVVARFENEMKITGMLQHPGIVPIYTKVSLKDGSVGYAMPFIAGQTLEAAIKMFHSKNDQSQHVVVRSFSEGEFRKLLTQFVSTCRTVSYAHSRKVIHRDLKPANIRLGSYGETLVMDWGLAAHEDSSKSKIGEVVGTAQYMSPEQKAGNKVTAATDIYSLGATLYELLTGHAPLTDPLSKLSTGSVTDKAKEGRPPAPMAVNPFVPKPLSAICVKAMSCDATERYESARAVADDIERWLVDEPVTAWREPFRDRVRRWMRRHPARVSVVFTVVVFSMVMLFSLGAGYVWYEKQQTDTARKRNAAVLYKFGVTRAEQYDLPTAIGYYEEALSLDPENAKTWNNLGVALSFQRDFPAAINAFQKALSINPQYDQARKSLGKAQQMLAMEKRLPGVLQGDAASVADLLTLADFCWHKERYRDAVQLFTTAFAADIESAKDLKNGYRYQAVRAAALAAGGSDIDGDDLKPKDQDRMRKQAFAWLQEELRARARQLTKEPAQLHDEMEKWQRDVDLASLREEKKLAKLSAGESAALQKFWGEVDRVAKNARSRYTQTERKGKLTGKESEKRYPLRTTAGKTYVINMDGTQFDTLLQLEDDQAVVVAKNDDISYPENLNSRIVFTAPMDGNYRIVATSYQQGATGSYRLRIREFAEEK